MQRLFLDLQAPSRGSSQPWAQPGKHRGFANEPQSRYIYILFFSRMAISAQLCGENQYLVFRCVNAVVSPKCPGQFTTRSAAASFQAIPRFPAYED